MPRFSKWPIPFQFPHINLEFLFSPIRVTRPSHSNFLDLITRILCGEEYKFRLLQFATLQVSPSVYVFLPLNLK
jgi:hypothetical protein